MSHIETTARPAFPDFPLAEVPPAVSAIDAALTRSLADATPPLGGDDAARALSAHDEFLANGGGGGHFQSLDLGGITLCVYDGTASAGTQLVLRHKRLAATVDCSNRNLSYADLSSSLCEGVSFAGATLVGSIAIDASFAGASFAGADLSNVDFSRSRLAGCSFAGATLVGADFENADLTGSDFTGTDVSGARFPGARLDGVVR